MQEADSKHEVHYAPDMTRIEELIQVVQLLTCTLGNVIASLPHYHCSQFSAGGWPSGYDTGMFCEDRHADLLPVAVSPDSIHEPPAAVLLQFESPPVVSQSSMSVPESIPEWKS